MKIVEGNDGNKSPYIYGSYDCTLTVTIVAVIDVVTIAAIIVIDYDQRLIFL